MIQDKINKLRQETELAENQLINNLKSISLLNQEGESSTATNTSGLLSLNSLSLLSLLTNVVLGKKSKMSKLSTGINVLSRVISALK